jgi:ribosomal protein L32
VRLGFPHPENWIRDHGEVQQKRGAQACTLCHAPTFCKGCHGTQIPHRATWLDEHYRAVEAEGDSPCYTCHPQTDCESCHTRHSVHREQSLYER